MSTAAQRYIKHAGETVNLAVDLRGLLDTGETCTGTPTIVEVTTSALTISAKVVNTAALTINGQTVAIGEAVTCRVAGGTAGVQYVIRVTVTTSASQVRIVLLRLAVVAD